jgi:hypothetical protein
MCLICGRTTSLAAFWVGIDGYSSDTVEQDGTIIESYEGTVYYYDWWVHRMFRGDGAPYPAYWRDRARNYLLLFEELGWDIAGLEKHLHELFDDVNPDKAQAIIDLARDELASPFAYFDAVKFL